MTEVLLEARLTAAFATNGCKCCLCCNVGHVEVELTNQHLLIPFLPDNQPLDFLVITKAATFIHWRFNPETRWWAFLLRCEISHQDLPVCVIVRGILKFTCHFLKVILKCFHSTCIIPKINSMLHENSERFRISVVLFYKYSHVFTVWDSRACTHFPADRSTCKASGTAARHSKTSGPWAFLRWAVDIDHHVVM